jgi:hypothetical protein
LKNPISIFLRQPQKLLLGNLDFLQYSGMFFLDRGESIPAIGNEWPTDMPKRSIDNKAKKRYLVPEDIVKLGSEMKHVSTH